MTLWPVVLDTQVLWSLHIVHYCIYYYLALILLYTTNNQSHSINTVICGLQISSYSLTVILSRKEGREESERFETRDCVSLSEPGLVVHARN